MNSGTFSKITVAEPEPNSTLTWPPLLGDRSSHSGAIRGWSFRNSPTDSVKSVSPEPKVRLPLELTYTSV